MAPMSTDLMQPTRQAIAAQDRSAKGKVTGRLKRALDEMVWGGSCRTDAARIAGMTDHSLREALKKPHVKAYYLPELGVLRESGRAKTFHRLEALRDQDDNKAAAVKACQVLEQIGDEELGRRSGNVTPGLVIVIEGTPREPTPIAAIPSPAPDTRKLLWIKRQDEPVREPIFRAPWDK
jgi:hypothetical protein